MSEQVGILQQLRDLHEIDQHILAIERELGQFREELAGMSDGVSGLETGLERVETELERARKDAHRSEKAVDDRRDTLDRIRTRVNQVQNERQYSAASLEFDLVRQEIRKLEDHAVDRLQVVEELENRHNDVLAQLESVRSEAGPRGVAIGRKSWRAIWRSSVTVATTWQSESTRARWGSMTGSARAGRRSASLS